MIIDISEFQNVDWKKISDVDGVIIRAGYGRNNPDGKFKSHIEGAISAGLPVGVYWFSYAYSADMARREAEYCAAACAPYKSKINLPVFFDWEGDSFRWAQKQGVNPTKTLISEMFRAFCQKTKELGYDAGYYLNLDYAKNYVDEGRLVGFKRWFAWWTSTEQKDCFLWQYTDKGQVQGIAGNVDLNKMEQGTLPNSGGGSVPVDPFAGKGDHDLALECIAGKYGNGEDRVKALGSRYDAVQAEVNRILAEQKETVYIVNDGDTLTKIARKYKTTVKKLVDRNGIKNPDLIHTGDRIVIPM